MMAAGAALTARCGVQGDVQHSHQHGHVLALQFTLCIAQVGVQGLVDCGVCVRVCVWGGGIVVSGEWGC